MIILIENAFKIKFKAATMLLNDQQTVQNNINERIFQLVFLNAALNFCLYCLVSERYRHLMRKTLKRLFHRKK